MANITPKKGYKEPYATALARLEYGWTQEAFARDKDGIAINPNDTKAECWCIAGAFGGESPKIHTLNKILKNKIKSSVYMFNDYPNTTKAKVLRIVEFAAIKDDAVIKEK